MSAEDSRLGVGRAADGWKVGGRTSRSANADLAAGQGREQ